MKSRVVALVLPVAVVIEGAVLVACWWAANLPQHSPARQDAIAIAPPAEAVPVDARSLVQQANLIPVKPANADEANYRIESPDILFVEIVKLIPRKSYRVEANDILSIQVTDTLAGKLILGKYRLESSGFMSLGPPYGSICIGGMTLKQIADKIEAHATPLPIKPSASVSLAEPRAQQQVAGEHLVDPDGKIDLGLIGKVRVANMTLREIRRAIEQQISQQEQHFAEVEVAVSVAAYNSKVYFVIVESPAGDQVYRYPCTDQVTVLDAVAQIPDLAGIASKKVWVQRPVANQTRDRVLVVDWQAIVRELDASSNYALQSGDRVYIRDQSKS